MQDKQKLTLYSVRDMTDILHCSRWTVYDWINRKGLPAFKLGRRLFTREEKLLKWIDKQERMSK